MTLTFEIIIGFISVKILQKEYHVFSLTSLFEELRKLQIIDKALIFLSTVMKKQ